MGGKVGCGLMVGAGVGGVLVRGGWCEVIVGNGVLGGGLLRRYKLPRFPGHVSCVL